MLRRYMATYDAEKAAQAHALFSPAGRRMSKTVDANTTDYLWSNVGRLPVVLYDGNYYVYGRGLIAKTDSQSDQLYYLADGLGSTTGLTDDQGDVVGTYTYDVFGAIRSETGGQANDFKFTRQQLDNETDFYYLRARYYDPSIGRFVGRDPLPFLNRYPYVGNNPVRYVDPSGLWSIDPRQIVDCVSDPGECAEETVEEVAEDLGDAAEPITDTVSSVNWRNVAVGGTLMVAGGALIGASILGTSVVVSVELAAAPETGLLSAVLVPHSIGIFGLWVGGIGVATAACGEEIIRTGECFGSGEDDPPQSSSANHPKE